MCMEDVKIKRNTKTRLYAITGTNEVIGGNANRLSIRICPNAGSQAFVFAVTPPFANGVTGLEPILGKSFDILTGTLSDYRFITPPDDITLDKVGDILLGPLRLVSLGADSYFIETYLDCPTDKPEGCI